MYQYNNTIQKMMMVEKKKWINLKNWPEIPDHSYKLLITGRSASEKKQSHYLIW